MYGSGLQKYRQSMMNPDKNEPKKISNQTKVLMASLASAIIMYRNWEDIIRLSERRRPFRGEDLPGYGENEYPRRRRNTF